MGIRDNLRELTLAINLPTNRIENVQNCATLISRCDCWQSCWHCLLSTNLFLHMDFVQG